MKALVKFTAVICFSLLFTSCAFDINFGEGKKGNGNVISQTRNVSNYFTGVEASEGLNVYVTQDNATNIRIEADENVIDLIRTDVRNGVLVVHTEQSIGRATKNIYVSMPTIERLKSNSGADLYSQGIITAERIALNVSSGADLEVEVKATHVEADASSGADIKVSGTATSLTADASSGSDIKASNLEVKRCTADASSGADIRVNVTETLTAEASSGGDVRYSGNPTVNSNKSSAGSVRKSN